MEFNSSLTLRRLIGALGLICVLLSIFCTLIIFVIMGSGMSQTHPHLPVFLVAAAIASPFLLPAIIVLTLWLGRESMAGSRMQTLMRTAGVLLGVGLVVLGGERQFNDRGDWFVYPAFWLTGICLVVVSLLVAATPIASSPGDLS